LCAPVPWRREKERGVDGGRRQPRREAAAAGQMFEGEPDENKRENFQPPECGHRHRTVNEKTEQRRQDNENPKRNAGRPAAEIVRDFY